MRIDDIVGLLVIAALVIIPGCRRKSGVGSNPRPTTPRPPAPRPMGRRFDQ